jgi:uncharacterized repeat protein (TIGR03803 family)
MLAIDEKILRHESTVRRNTMTRTSQNWRHRSSTLNSAAAFALAALLALTALSISAQAQTLTVLYSFTGGTDGYLPASSLIRDSGGDLYGVTFRGGDSNCDRGSSCGVLFKIDASGKETVLHRFSGKADGAYPVGSLTLDSAGNLYGAANNGGNLACDQGFGCGTVFKFDTTGKLTTLHIFTGTDGAGPNGGLILDAAGNLYGTTFGGGNASNSGTVFKIDAAGNYTVLYRFTGKADGKNPIAGVIEDADGNLFGTTYRGGTFYFGSGTVFKLDSTGKETVLHTFIPNGLLDGADPYAGVVPYGEDFYGTTSAGGSSEFGTVFKLDKAGDETVLYNFLGGTDGRYPQNSGVIQDSSGNFYGTTENGGDSNDDGTVFKVDQTGTETVLHRFTGADGSRPMAGVIEDAAGNLYGTTYQGGAFGYGTVFKIVP